MIQLPGVSEIEYIVLAVADVDVAINEPTKVCPSCPREEGAEPNGLAYAYTIKTQICNCCRRTTCSI